MAEVLQKDTEILVESMLGVAGCRLWRSVITHCSAKLEACTGSF